MKDLLSAFSDGDDEEVDELVKWARVCESQLEVIPKNRHKAVLRGLRQDELLKMRSTLSHSVLKETEFPKIQLGRSWARSRDRPTSLCSVANRKSCRRS